MQNHVIFLLIFWTTFSLTDLLHTVMCSWKTIFAFGNKGLKSSQGLRPEGPSSCQVTSSMVTPHILTYKGKTYNNHYTLAICCPFFVAFIKTNWKYIFVKTTVSKKWLLNNNVKWCMANAWLHYAQNCSFKTTIL